MNPNRLDKIIHERVRLAVMSALVTRGEMTFPELKELLDVTDGNLSVHTSILEKHDLISVKKEFQGRKPSTTFAITAKGREEFTRYIQELELLLKPRAYK